MESLHHDVLGRLVSVYTPPRAEDRAIEVQTILTERGHHLHPGPAGRCNRRGERPRRTSLDKDYELVPEITRPPVERLATPTAL